MAVQEVSCDAYGHERDARESHQRALGRVQEARRAPGEPHARRGWRFRGREGRIREYPCTVRPASTLIAANREALGAVSLYPPSPRPFDISRRRNPSRRPSFEWRTSETAAAIKRARDHRAAETVPGRGSEARVQIPPKQQPRQPAIQSIPRSFVGLRYLAGIKSADPPCGTGCLLQALVPPPGHDPLVLSPSPDYSIRTTPRPEPVASRRSLRGNRHFGSRSPSGGGTPLLAAVRAALCPPLEITGRTTVGQS